MQDAVLTEMSPTAEFVHVARPLPPCTRCRPGYLGWTEIRLILRTAVVHRVLGGMSAWSPHTIRAQPRLLACCAEAPRKGTGVSVGVRTRYKSLYGQM